MVLNMEVFQRAGGRRLAKSSRGGRTNRALAMAHSLYDNNAIQAADPTCGPATWDGAIERLGVYVMLMTGEAYRESLRAMSPRVFINGDRIESVADEPRCWRRVLRRLASLTTTRWKRYISH